VKDKKNNKEKTARMAVGTQRRAASTKVRGGAQQQDKSGSTGIKGGE
jgi:hypothetical protein